MAPEFRVFELHLGERRDQGPLREPFGFITEMAKFAASGGSGDGLNLGERSGRLALANGLCKDNRDQPKADVPPFLRCSRNDRRLSAVRTKLRWPVT